MKKLILLILVCALCLSAFVGCDSKKPTNKEPSAVESTDQVSAVVPNAPEQDEIWKDFDPYATISDSIKGSTVRFATWIDHTQTEGAVPFANFEADTGLKVELFSVPQASYVSSIRTKISSGDIPDVFVANSDWPMILEIAAPVNLVSSINLEEPIWDQSMLKTATLNGNIYAVNTIGSPWSGSNMTFYNKRLFEENGFKSPKEYYEEGTWTWDAFLNCAKQIVSLGDDMHGASVEANILLDSINAGLIKYNYETQQFTSGITEPELLEGFQWFAEAKEQGLLSGTQGSFVNGKTGMILLGPYGLKTTGYFKSMDFGDVGYTYLPTLEEGDKPTISSMWRMYGIVEGAPNADAAGYFLRYWLDPANYDLDNTFISVDAGNYYYELTNTTAVQKHFNFEETCMSIIGEDNIALRKELANTTSAGMKTALDSIANKVENAVNECNKIIAGKIDTDSKKYSK